MKKNYTLIYLIFILLIYVGPLVFMWPWKSHVLNVLDVVTCTALALMITAALPFTVGGGMDSGGTTETQAIFLVIGFWLIAIGSVLGYVFCSTAQFVKELWESEDVRQKRLEKSWARSKQLAQSLLHISAGLTRLEKVHSARMTYLEINNVCVFIGL